jgi:sugar diacid utilization regulator
MADTEAAENRTPEVEQATLCALVRPRDHCGRSASPLVVVSPQPAAQEVPPPDPEPPDGSAADRDPASGRVRPTWTRYDEPDPVVRLIATLQERQAELIDESVRAIRGSIPAYARIEDPELTADVRAHLEGHHAAILRSIAEGRALDHEEMLFVRPHATRRVGRVPLLDFIRSLRVYQDTVWRAALESATDEESRDAALRLVGIILDYHNVAATHAGEVYLEVERLLSAHGEQVRHELLNDLLAGRPVTPGPRMAAARDAGLEAATQCLVVVALPAVGTNQEHLLRSAGAALVRAIGPKVQPLTAVRGEEVVIVTPAEQRDPSELAAALVAAQRRLADQGVRLAIGVSTIQERLEGLPEAYREAHSALERVREEGGVVALPALRAFDYLTRFSHETVRRLVPAAIRRFVSDDLAEGGVLTSTLLEYVAVDLNVKAAAERLHLHANTAHYRLARIEERTGCDVRRLADVLDLLIAVQAARGAPESHAA